MPKRNTPIAAATSAAVRPHQTPFGEEVIEFLQGLDSLHNLDVVTVISENGWSWVLGWAQLGVWTVDCVAFTDEASMVYGGQLTSILGCQGFDLVLQGPREGSTVICGGPTHPNVVCALLLANPGLPFLNYLGSVPASSFLLLTLDRSLLPILQSNIGGQYRWEELCHRHLGGLTSARVVALWRSHSTANDVLLRPGEIRSPSRSLSAFLEPSICLTS